MNPTQTLRRGYMAQFWAGLYALTTVYPQPRLTAFLAALLAILATLIYSYRPTP